MGIRKKIRTAFKQTFDESLDTLLSMQTPRIMRNTIGTDRIIDLRVSEGFHILNNTGLYEYFNGTLPNDNLPSTYPIQEGFDFGDGWEVQGIAYTTNAGNNAQVDMPVLILGKEEDFLERGQIAQVSQPYETRIKGEKIFVARYVPKEIQAKELAPAEITLEVNQKIPLAIGFVPGTFDLFLYTEQHQDWDILPGSFGEEHNQFRFFNENNLTNRDEFYVGDVRGIVFEMSSQISHSGQLRPLLDYLNEQGFDAQAADLQTLKVASKFGFEGPIYEHLGMMDEAFASENPDWVEPVDSIPLVLAYHNDDDNHHIHIYSEDDIPWHEIIPPDLDFTRNDLESWVASTCGNERLVFDQANGYALGFENSVIKENIEELATYLRLKGYVVEDDDIVHVYRSVGLLSASIQDVFGNAGVESEYQEAGVKPLTQVAEPRMAITYKPWSHNLVVYTHLHNGYGDGWYTDFHNNSLLITEGTPPEEVSLDLEDSQVNVPAGLHPVMIKLDRNPEYHVLEERMRLFFNERGIEIKYIVRKISGESIAQSAKRIENGVLNFLYE
jgi:hypothetical protein